MSELGNFQAHRPHTCIDLALGFFLNIITFISKLEDFKEKCGCLRFEWKQVLLEIIGYLPNCFYLVKEDKLIVGMVYECMYGES